MPEPFHAVARWYEHMTQASDEEVCQLLEQAWKRRAHEVRQAHPFAPAAQASAPPTPSNP
jgi:hypothetical protein